MSMIDYEVAIIGAGFSGIGLGIQLRKAGIEDFVVVDAADGVGGVWRHNTYPGVAVDIPSTTYSYSFEPNTSWSSLFAPGDELCAYAEHCADKYGVRKHLRLRTYVEKAVFDEPDSVWRIHTSEGVITTRFLISAVGPLDKPKNPDIEGIETFAGKLIHTARWDHSADLAGDRVAVIGTGASGLQVIPEIAPLAAHLDVYQRTPIWVIPKPNLAIPAWARRMFELVPATHWGLRSATTAMAEFIMTVGGVYHTRVPFLVRGIERVCKRHLQRQVHDPELRRKLSPEYAFGCKRPSFSSTYLPTFNRDDVELVTDPIVRITPEGIVTRQGDTGETLRPIDTLVLATGFKVMELGAVPAFPVQGLDGIELGAYWDEHRYENYEGISTPLAPNFWLMNGPWAAAGSSWFNIIESGSRHVVRCITEARRRDAVGMVVKQGPHDAYMASMRRKMKHTVFVQPSCSIANSYYFDRHGEAPFVRPVSGPALWLACRRFDLDDYAYTVRPALRIATVVGSATAGRTTR
jgi:cation diffusion facilitator CzcD-associated flavoprotein CzcO